MTNIYKDKKTGVVMLAESELSGDWELVEVKEEPTEVKEEKPKKKTKKVETTEE